MNRRQRYGMALLCGALTGLAPLSIDMYLPSLPALARQLHTTASLAQLSLTMCLLGLALGQLVGGPLSDRFGRRRPLIVGMVLYTVTAFLCTVAPSVWLLITIRLLQGLSGAFGIVIARAATRDVYSGTELTRFYALLMLVNGVAPIAAPVIGGQLLRFTSWRGVFVVLGVVSIVITLSVVAFLRETLPKLNVLPAEWGTRSRRSGDCCAIARSWVTRAHRGWCSRRCSGTFPGRHLCCRTRLGFRRRCSAWCSP